MDRWLFIRKEEDLLTILNALLNSGYDVLIRQDEPSSEFYSMQIVHKLFDEDKQITILDLENENVYTNEEIKQIREEM